uniref:MFS domain-containing protein n=1 Tax=Syphacia muris TaxID=451379 RepID=A0A0N5AN00_9BILA
MKFDEFLFTHLGEFGRYQMIQFALICIPSMFVAMNSLSWTFTAANLPHRCRISDQEPLNSSYWTNSNQLHSISCNASDGLCRYETCRLGNENKCPYGYLYDHSEIKNSAISQWDIVCDRSVLKAIIQSLYYVGQMTGSFIFGVLGDRIGRKKVFFMSLVILMASSALSAIAPHWTLFGLLRLAIGLSHPGIFGVGVVLGTELVGPSKRKIALVLSCIFFSLGQVVLGLLAYHIRDYQVLQLAISMPILIFISYWWLIPESARWLVSLKRYNEANEILQRAANINKVNLPDKWWEQLDLIEGKKDEEKSKPKYGYMDLFKTPIIRKRILVSIYLWPVVSMVYYGVSMKTDFLGGDLYFTFIIGSISEIPALLFLHFGADRIGRKPIFGGSYIVAAFCMLSNLLLPPDGNYRVYSFYFSLLKFVIKVFSVNISNLQITVIAAHWSLSLLQFIFTKASITICYAAIYMITSELFPTVIRNTAIGCCSTVARLGSISASYIAMWLVESVGSWAMVIPFGSCALIAGLLVFLIVPETMGQALPETIEELECPESFNNKKEMSLIQNFNKGNNA